MLLKSVKCVIIYVHTHIQAYTIDAGCLTRLIISVTDSLQLLFSGQLLWESGFLKNSSIQPPFHQTLWYAEQDAIGIFGIGRSGSMPFLRVVM